MNYGSKMILNQTDTVCQPTCHAEFQHCHSELVWLLFPLRACRKVENVPMRAESVYISPTEQTLKQVQGDRTFGYNDTISVQHDTIEHFLSFKEPVTAFTPPPRSR